jgi:lipoprotein-anchoring transpeptidase ErfK/SrfK
MSKTRQVTIAALIVAAIVVWGFGLGSALQVKSTSGQKLAAEPSPTPTTAMAESTPVIPGFTPTQPAETGETPAARAQPPFGSAQPSFGMPTPTERLLDKPASPPPTATATRRPIFTPTRPAVPFGTPTIPAEGRFLLVNQDEQKMHVYENGVEIRTIPVSTGAPVANAFTPPWRGTVGDYWGGGPFRDNNYWADYMWYLFPGEEGSILIHSVPYLRSGDMKIYDRPDALGVRPASHGCIRISPEEAEWLKAWNPVGVPIEITPWSGEIGPPDASYGQ